VPDSLKGGRYEIREILGQGTTGVVYKCLDATTRTEVALKLLRDAPDKLALEIFRKDCGVLAGIGHPNVVEIIDAGELPEASGRPFYVMPLLAGVPLDRLIREGARHLNVERVAELIAQACRGLQAAHERGLVHRNIKPGNLFILPGGAARLTDFGVASKAATSYTAPEVAAGQPASALSDVYSLAAVAVRRLRRSTLPHPRRFSTWCGRPCRRTRGAASHPRGTSAMRCAAPPSYRQASLPARCRANPRCLRPRAERHAPPDALTKALRRSAERSSWTRTTPRPVPPLRIWPRSRPARPSMRTRAAQPGGSISL
jgi:serine/threonine protein kinase